MKKNNLYILHFSLRTLMAIFLMLGFNAAQAQPIIDTDEYLGCKKAGHVHLHKAPALTMQEELSLQNSVERSDTIDILHYNINLDFRDFSFAQIKGYCEISIKSKMNDVESITLDLLDFDIDSVDAQGQLLTYSRNDNFITVHFPTPLGVDSEYDFSVHYNGKPTPAASGFGGLVFSGGIAYNLGIGLGATPYNYGRGWFPCFDTFVERSTYEFNIISNGNRRAYCSGTFMGENDLGNGAVLRSFELNQEIPTYLAGIAVGDYQSWNVTHPGAFGDVPLEILALPNDLNAVVSGLNKLDEIVDALEFWWGAHPWERVGYVMTGNGAMEHATNVAYPLNVALNGSEAQNNELVAHELGHSWWGNIVTLNDPENMWIKEGPAEYSSYLIYEYIFNRDEFNRINKENLLRVIEEAHIDDDGYQALSPMPYDQTYGTHTYQKGALVIHNLRGYLGDDLFKTGMKAVLDEYAYGHMDAFQFRDALTQATGVDLGPFFDAWIFAPGYAAYEVEDITASAQGSNFEVALTIQQKLHAATVLHKQVPLNVTFVSDDFEFHHELITVSEELTTVNLTVPFEPATVFLNGEHELNLAVIGSHKTVTETGQTGIQYGGLGAQVIELTDSAFIRLEEYRVLPDPSPTNVYDARLSSNHYFRVAGVAKDGLVMKGTYAYNSNLPGDIDYDLVEITEDSLVLLYRPNQNEDWIEYPDYELKTFGSSVDGFGFVEIEPMVFGEYVLANAVIPTTSSEDILKEKIDWAVFPNPTADQIIVGGDLPENGDYEIRLFDLQGKNIIQQDMQVNQGEFNVTINLQDVPNGMYIAKIVDANGKEWGSEQVEKLK
ncbi:MAG: M1 family aminopeptidase [Bacteroidota bacterium]